MATTSPQNEKRTFRPTNPSRPIPESDICRVPTASGEVLFELTPQKVKENFLEMVQHHLVNMNVLSFGDIAFSTVLNMSSLNTRDDGALDQSMYSSNLYAALGQKYTEEQRYAALRRVCGIVLYCPSYETLRGDVSELLDKDAMKEGIELMHNYDIHEKALVFAKNKATKNITTVPRNRANEFRIVLHRHVVGTDLLLPKSSFYFPYSTPFYLWLSTVSGEIGLDADANTGAESALEGYFWLYRLVNNGRVGNEWCSVKSEMSYLDMLEKLKTGGIAFLVHSTEQRTYADSKTERISMECGLDDIKDRNGEPFFSKGTYLDYLRTSLE